ncbi:hypothetical protein D3C77_422880 [compost metagenome]
MSVPHDAHVLATYMMELSSGSYGQDGTVHAAGRCRCDNLDQDAVLRNLRLFGRTFYSRFLFFPSVQCLNQIVNDASRISARRDRACHDQAYFKSSCGSWRGNLYIATFALV